jgi:hypothetical protein
MKTHHVLWSVTLGILIASSAGCGKKEAEPVTPPPTPQASQTAPATDMAKPAVDTAAADAAAKAAAAESNKLAQAAAQANEKVTGIIDTVKKLVSENKYQEALQALTGLAQLNLSAEQQKIVDGLKEQITNALAQKAAGDAVGGLLKKP